MTHSWRISALAERHRALGSNLEDWNGMGTAWTYSSDLADHHEAIRTKACISSSREASVMAKLGHTKRENEALKEQLGVGTKHKSVKGAGLEQFYIDEGGNRRQTANRLKKIALEMGLAGDIIDIEDPNYGTVKAYPVSVIERFKLEVAA